MRHVSSSSSKIKVGSLADEVDAFAWSNQLLGCWRAALCKTTSKVRFQDFPLLRIFAGVDILGVDVLQIRSYCVVATFLSFFGDLVGLGGLNVVWDLRAHLPLTEWTRYEYGENSLNTAQVQVLGWYLERLEGKDWLNLLRKWKPSNLTTMSSHVSEVVGFLGVNYGKNMCLR